MMETYPNSAGFVRGSATSEAAAERVNKKRVSTEKSVYEYIKYYNGYAIWKQAALDMKLSSRTVQPRFTELKKRGLIEPTGQVSFGCEMFRVTGKPYTPKGKVAPTGGSKTKREYYEACRSAHAALLIGNADLAKNIIARVINAP